jgi:hypothetical protein
MASEVRKRVRNVSLNIWNPPSQAVTSEGTQRDFGKVEPAAVLGSMVDCSPFD